MAPGRLATEEKEAKLLPIVCSESIRARIGLLVCMSRAPMLSTHGTWRGAASGPIGNDPKPTLLFFRETSIVVMRNRPSSFLNCSLLSPPSRTLIWTLREETCWRNGGTRLPADQRACCRVIPIT